MKLTTTHKKSKKPTTIKNHCTYISLQPHATPKMLSQRVSRSKICIHCVDHTLILASSEPATTSSPPAAASMQDMAGECFAEAPLLPSGAVSCSPTREFEAISHTLITPSSVPTSAMSPFVAKHPRDWLMSVVRSSCPLLNSSTFILPSEDAVTIRVAPRENFTAFTEEVCGESARISFWDRRSWNSTRPSVAPDTTRFADESRWIHFTVVS